MSECPAFTASQVKEWDGYDGGWRRWSLPCCRVPTVFVCSKTRLAGSQKSDTPMD